MYILTDLTELKFLYKHPNLEALCNLAWIEIPETDFEVITTASSSFLIDLTLTQLQVLYRNSVSTLTGKEPSVVYSAPQLRALLADIAERLPVTELNAFEVERQAAHLEAGTHCGYRYVKGTTKPSKSKNIFAPSCLKVIESSNVDEIIKKQRFKPAVLVGKISNPTACYQESDCVKVPSSPQNGLLFQNPTGASIMPKDELTPEQKAEAQAAKEQAKQEAAAKKKADAEAAKAAKAQAKAEADEAKKAAKEKAKADKEAAKEASKAARESSRMPEQNGIRRPKAESVCGKAWAIFDGVSAKNGKPASIAEAMEAGKADAINEDTMRTQYARWRKFHGIVGRVDAPKAETASA